ncbi:hypothetical protein EJV47_13610 [Hymenobacter gummosus]|uniref:Uncharacterized protein n=1 Tax=Hymenobacter gummosus TaxID=1776032 RepID=A0A3S0H4I3_9BACT|nr:hypothetical protein [Hymenobacter gummosus]RTQ49179.1 hypothetical protein EJV47_13610 [Hymenobacter gummosus]
MPGRAQARVELNPNPPYNVGVGAGYVSNSPNSPAYTLFLDNFSGSTPQYPSLLKISRSGRAAFNRRDYGDPDCGLSVGLGMGSVALDDLGGTFNATLNNPLVPTGAACIGLNAIRQANFDGYFRLEPRAGANGGAVVWANNEGALHFSTVPSSSGTYANWVSSSAVASTYSRLKIHPDGRVQIGRGPTTASPHFANYRLAVDGKLVAQSIHVVGPVDWADFVFAPTYRLLPLPELERYLQQHRHLPGIPTAQEVEAQGVDLAAMQAKLLQQVEELTLRVIELDKQNQQLRSEVKALTGQER